MDAARPAYPTLSLAERDRRWGRTRELLEREGVEGVVAFGTGRDPADTYLTNEVRHSVVFLTLADDPVMFPGDVPLDHFDEPGDRWERWVADWVAGDPVEALIARVRNAGLDRARLGIVGASSRGVMQKAGHIPYRIWTSVLAGLPDVEWVDIADAYESMTIVYGAEEQVMLRKAAELGERGCEAFVQAAREGGNEHEIVAASFEAIIAGGGWVREPFMLERAGRSMFAWSIPEWFGMGGAPHILQRGDTIAAEIFAFYGGIESQQQIDVVVGEPSPLLRELERVCRDSYEAGLAALRPGMLFSELAAVMEAPLLASGTWNTGPMVQTVPPIYNSATRLNPGRDAALAVLPQLPLGVPRDGDFVIEVGHAFAFEPNALRDGQRVCVGGTVLLSESGVEELNTLPNHLVVI